MNKKNAMSSEVKEGYQCKPKELEENKPIMFSSIQIFLCSGERCQQIQTQDLARKIMEVIRELHFDKGKNRIKVTKTFCQGACRYKNMMCIYKNTESENFKPENAYSAWKKVHEWSDEQWKYFINSLSQAEDPVDLSEFKVEARVYDEVKCNRE
jgi:cobalt-precorrin 5A hydrolase